MGLIDSLFKQGKKEEEKLSKNQIRQQKVDDHFAYLLSIYNDYVDSYQQNEEERESINIQYNAMKYLKTMENGLMLTKNVYDRISSLPYVYEIPKHTQEYIQAAKREFLLHLEFYIKRDEVLKQAITEFMSKGKNMKEYEENANNLVVKADMHFETAIHYIEEARRSVK